MKQEQYEQVARILLGCADHTKDNDWATNDKKMYCQVGICRVALCIRCAVHGRYSAGVLIGYCKEHAKS